ncbi:MAG: DnaJ C-terminal domain-containing protein [Vicinamibacterales bacterium]
MEFRDYYATLGVPKNASEKDIKQAFRKLARKYHPDVNPGDKAAELRFKEINEANEVLSDPEKRRKYDELGSNWRQYEQNPSYGRPGQGTWTVNVGPDGQPFDPQQFEEAFGGTDSPFSDFFRTFFGGAPGPERPRGTRSGRRRPSMDVEQDIALSLEEVFQGAQRRFSIKTPGHTRTVDVRIPAGVGDGARVRVPGESKGEEGDIFLRVHVLPHDRFERDGQNLQTTVQIPMLTAVLGGEAEVTTLGGKTLRLRIPETTQNGQVFRLKGHGMPATKAGDAGDLYVAVDVQLPRTLSAEARQHYQALERLDER